MRTVLALVAAMWLACLPPVAMAQMIRLGAGFAASGAPIPPPPPAAGTWLATLNTPALIYSNGNDTVALNAADTAGTNAATYETTPRAGGKYYLELTVSYTGSPCCFSGGFVDSAALPTTGTSGGLTNAYSGASIIFSTGVVSGGGSASLATLGAVASGSVVAFAYDVTNKAIWIKAGCAGQWNASSTANPATATGGLSLTGGTINTPYPAAGDGYFTGTADVATINVGATAFACPIPAGFTAWN